MVHIDLGSFLKSLHSGCKRLPRAKFSLSAFALALLMALVAMIGLSPAALAQEVAEFEWVHQFGSSEGGEALGIAVDSTGVYVSGLTSGALPEQSSAGGLDAFIRKYDTEGNHQWTRQFGTPSSDYVGGIFADLTGVYVVGDTGAALPGQVYAGGTDVFIRKYDSDGNEIWTHQFGTPSTDHAFGVSGDSSGVYMVGETSGVLPGSTGAGSADAFVRKYDSDGNHLWTRQFGTSARDEALDISAGSNGIYVVGATQGVFPGQTGLGSGDVFVRKYKSNGNEVWTRQFGSSFGDIAYGVSVDATGVYVAGETDGTLPGQTSAGGGDAFIRKYKPNGREVWTRQFGTPSYDEAFGVSSGSAGVYVSGYTDGVLPGQTSLGGWDAYARKYDADGNEVWTFQFGTSSNDYALRNANDGTGLYVAGQVGGDLPGQSSAGGADPFVVKLSEGGTVTPPDTGTDQTTWIRQFGATSLADEALGVSVDSSGVYVAGQTVADAFVRKYDSDGNLVWTRQFGSSSFVDEVLGISVDASGVYVGGFTAGTLPGQTNFGGGDAFVRKYDADGNEIWTRQFGTASGDRVLGISVESTGVFVAGYTFGTFPGQTPSASKDAFVRKYETNGNYVWTRQFGSPSLADEVLGISVDSSGVYLAGYTFGPSPAESKDAFVAKYDSDGTELWTHQFGSSSIADEAVGISVDSSGVYVVVQTVDDFVRKYDLDGNELWTRQPANKARAISVDPSGVYVTGGAAFVQKYDANGSEVWARQFVGGPLAISVHSSGVYVSGAKSGDAFVAKLSLTGTMQVASIELSFLTEGRKIEAVAQILMEDEDGFPVPGATVTGDLFLNGKLLKEGIFGVTGSDGVATIRSGRINRAKSGDTIGFCVTGATGSHNFVASNNVETCDYINKP